MRLLFTKIQGVHFLQHKIVAEDICALRFVGDAQPAADGRVAYTVTEVDLAKNGYSTAIWVSTPDGAQRRFTYGQRADGKLTMDTRPRWTPAGDLAFVSNRNGKSQLFYWRQQVVKPSSLLLRQKV